MENHPIPQDVTGFQFKLIGSMTIKQFGFIAAGVIPAVIFYYAPIFLLLKVILVPLCGLTGVAMAFLPIEGRPMDVMIANFFKALFAPNQYLFHKEGRKLAIAHMAPHPIAQKNMPGGGSKQQDAKRQQLASYLQTVHTQTQSKLDEKEAAYVTALTSQSAPAMQFTSPAPIQGAVSQPVQPISILPIQPGIVAPTIQSPVQLQSPVVNKAVEPENTPAQTAPAISPQPIAPAIASPVMSTSPVVEEKTERPVAIQQVQPVPQVPVTVSPEPIVKQTSQESATQAAAQPPTSGDFPIDIGSRSGLTAAAQPDGIKTQLEEIAAQKAQLETELAKLKEQLSAQKEPAQQAATQPSPEPEEKKEDFQHVRKVPQDLLKTVGLGSAPDVPNLISGIVKDPRGNVQGNILVEIKDKEGNPVRAFKTNPLGQFASATPLTNGVYSIEFEDPKKEQRFDTIEITVNDTIILPLEVISHDDREELRRALFN